MRRGVSFHCYVSLWLDFGCRCGGIRAAELHGTDSDIENMCGTDTENIYGTDSDIENMCGTDTENIYGTDSDIKNMCGTDTENIYGTDSDSESCLRCKAWHFYHNCQAFWLAVGLQ